MSGEVLGKTSRAVLSNGSINKIDPHVEFEIF